MDVLIITGMPRSGTTFLHRVFSGWRFPGFWAVPGKPEYGRTGVSNLWTTDEPPALSKVLLDQKNPMPALRELVGIWRTYVNRVYRHEKATIVYKHPQFCFTPWLEWVLRDPLLKVGFVFCRRGEQGWLSSMNSIGPGSSNNIHYKVIWGGPFDYPHEEQERLKYFYGRLDMCIRGASRQIPNDRKTVFEFEQPEESLHRVLDFVGVRGKVPHLMDKFWVTDQAERQKRRLTNAE